MEYHVILFLLLCIFAGSSVILAWIFNLTYLYALIPPMLLLLVVFLVLPLFFSLSSSIRRNFVYQHTSKVESDRILQDPSGQGILGSRNIYLTLPSGERIGLWHILPKYLIPDSYGKAHDDQFWSTSLATSEQIILYFHGNTGTRALDHRKELYWSLQEQNLHVISFDYRGFGDSSPVKINEETTIEDGIFVFKWLLNLLKESSGTKIIIWGHSLGTGIASSTVTFLQDFKNLRFGLILEAPFTDIQEAMKNHKKAKLFRALPYFNFAFIRPLHKKSRIAYRTHEYIIANKNIPVLILHAEDDETVPVSLGRKLYDIGFQGRVGKEAQPIYMKIFEKGHGHKYICRSPELSAVINTFISSLPKAAR